MAATPRSGTATPRGAATTTWASPAAAGAGSTMTGAGAVTIAIDRIACDGYGSCAELLPEMIRLDEWGYPIINPGPVPDHLLGHARMAVDTCPVLALRLTAARRATISPATGTRGARVARRAGDHKGG